jgi:hypothetical protein
LRGNGWSRERLQTIKEALMNITFFPAVGKED